MELLGLPALALAILAPLPQEAPLCVEEGGIALMEVESHPPVKGWTLKTDPKGFSGAGYLQAEGGGLLVFPVFISTPGRYTLNLHNRHDHPRNDLENDAFVRIDSGPFIKCFSSTSAQWTWASTLEYSASRKVPPEYDLDAGLHRIEIRQRSENFKIDRIALFLSGGEAGKAARDLARPETRGTPPLPPLEGHPKAAAAWQAGRLGVALSHLEAAKDDPAAAAAAELLRGLSARRKEAAEQLRISDPLAASEVLSFHAQTFLAGHPSGKEWSALASSWKDEPAAKRELRARLLLRGIEDQASKIRDAGQSSDERFAKLYARPLSAILQALLELRKSFPDTQARKRAESIAAGFGLGKT